MRHLRSILYALVLAPAVWILCGVGLTRDLTGRAGDAAGRVETASAILLLVLAGAAYAILVFAPISPLGPALAGLVFLGVSLWALLAPESYAGVWPDAITKEGFDLSRPGYALAALLAVPMLCTALSARRWERYEPPQLLLIGTLGRARGEAVAPGTTVAAERTAVISAADPTGVVTVAAPGPAPAGQVRPTPMAGVATDDEPTVSVAKSSGDEPAATVTRSPGDEPTTTVMKSSDDEPTATVTRSPGDEPTATVARTREDVPAGDVAPGDEPTTTVSGPVAEEPTTVAVEPATDEPTGAATARDEPTGAVTGQGEPGGAVAADKEATEPATAEGEPTEAATAGHPEAATAGEEPAQDEPAQDEPAQDEPAQDEAAQDEAAQDEPAQDEAAKSEPAADGPPGEVTAERPAPSDDEERTQLIRLRIDPEAPTHPIDPGSVTRALGPGETTQVIFRRDPSDPTTREQVARNRAATDQAARDRAAQQRARQAFRDRAAQERARQAFEERAARAAREVGESTQVITPRQGGEIPGDRTQVIPPGTGMVEPPGDRTQVLRFPVPAGHTIESQEPPARAPSIVGQERPDPGADPTTRLVAPQRGQGTGSGERTTADVASRPRSLLDLERPADEARDDTRRSPSQRRPPAEDSTPQS